MPPRPQPALDRLTKRSVIQVTERSTEIGDCLVWMGCRQKKGYGQIAYRNRPHLVHRVAWEERYGPIPDGQLVLHHCDNPPCWRDDHLYLGTHARNSRDMVTRGRHHAYRITHCPAGHEYTPGNTYTHGGRRNCRTCVLARLARTRERKRNA